MIKLRSGPGRALTALLGTCLVGTVLVVPSHAYADIEGFETAASAADRDDVPLETTASAVVGEDIVTTTWIYFPKGATDVWKIKSVTTTPVDEFRASIDAPPAPPVDGKELELPPGIASITMVVATWEGRRVPASVRSFLYDWDGNGLADITSVATICTDFGPVYSSVDTKLADLNIPIQLGGIVRPDGRGIC